MSVKVAVVGSGPSGCYLAQALRKLLPDSVLTILDRVPVPYGLVRYGVAPDHQGTKAVTKQFARLFERDAVEFIGNVDVGTDIDLASLREMFDVVVLATGLSADRSLGAAFDGVTSVYGSGRVTRHWNGHPDRPEDPITLGETVAVVGNGNVAMDVVRLLAKADYDGSDIHGESICTGVRQIHLIGRSSAQDAKFDATMVRELGQIDGLGVTMADTLPVDPDNKVLVELHALAGKTGGRVGLTFHFHTAPHAPEVTGGRLTGLMCDVRGERETIACDSVITAIGFEPSAAEARQALLGDAIDIAHGHLSDGLFATGWFRRGPSGTIATNRSDAKMVATRIAEVTVDAARPGRDALRAALGHQTTSYSDWLAIDRKECDTAPPNRIRKKITRREDMLELCLQGTTSE